MDTLQAPALSWAERETDARDKVARARRWIQQAAGYSGTVKASRAAQFIDEIDAVLPVMTEGDAFGAKLWEGALEKIREMAIGHSTAAHDHSAGWRHVFPPGVPPIEAYYGRRICCLYCVQGMNEFLREAGLDRYGVRPGEYQ